MISRESLMSRFKWRKRLWSFLITRWNILITLCPRVAKSFAFRFRVFEFVPTTIHPTIGKNLTRHYQFSLVLLTAILTKGQNYVRFCWSRDFHVTHQALSETRKNYSLLLSLSAKFLPWLITRHASETPPL